MATVRKTAEKNANAVLAIKNASTKLAKQFNIEIPEFPDVRRFDPEYGQAEILEYLGNVLTTVADASQSAKPKPAEKAKVEASKEKAETEKPESKTKK